MKQSVILYLCTAVVMWPLDLLWLGLVARTIYRREIGGLLLDRPEIVPAALFYLVYVVGIVVFAVRPAVQSGELATALAYGALFGFMAYATYDLTNLATLRGYTPGDRIHRPRVGHVPHGDLGRRRLPAGPCVGKHTGLIVPGSVRGRTRLRCHPTAYELACPLRGTQPLLDGCPLRL